MASAADMLVEAVSRPCRRPTTVNTTRALWRRGIELAQESGMTKRPSQPPRMTWRQALIFAGFQLLAFVCLMRWWGFFPGLRPWWLALVGVALAASPQLTRRAVEDCVVERLVAWLMRDRQALAAALDRAAGTARDRGQQFYARGRHRAATRAYLRAGAFAMRADEIRRTTLR